MYSLKLPIALILMIIAICTNHFMVVHSADDCAIPLNYMCNLPGRFVGVVDARYYEKFVDAEGVPIMGSRDVEDVTLVNFGKLIKKVMQHLQPDIIRAILDRKQRIVVLAKGDSFCNIPEISWNHYLSPGKPCSQPGALGVNFKNLIIVTEGESNCDYRGNPKSGRVLLHEFGHAINFSIDERVDWLKRMLDSAAANANATGLLTGLKDQGRPHYFTWGYLSYMNANECHANFDAYRDRLCTRSEFLTYDPTLYSVIQQVLPTLNWDYTCQDVCNATNIIRAPCNF